MITIAQLVSIFQAVHAVRVAIRALSTPRSLDKRPPLAIPAVFRCCTLVLQHHSGKQHEFCLAISNNHHGGPGPCLNSTLVR